MSPVCSVNYVPGLDPPATRGLRPGLYYCAASRLLTFCFNQSRRLLSFPFQSIFGCRSVSVQSVSAAGQFFVPISLGGGSVSVPIELRRLVSFPFQSVSAAGQVRVPSSLGGWSWQSISGLKSSGNLARAWSATRENRFRPFNRFLRLALKPSSMRTRLGRGYAKAWFTLSMASSISAVLL